MLPSDFEFKVTSFKAADGECLFVRCVAEGESFNLLVDGGRGGLKESIRKVLLSLPEEQRHIDAFMVTHVDDDHIVGAIEILEDTDLKSIIKDVWFNSSGLEVQNPVTHLTVENGNKLVGILAEMGDRWNRRFSAGAIVWPDHGALRASLMKHTSVTVLGPSQKDFDQLRKRWPTPDEEREPEEKERPSYVTTMGQDDIDIQTLGSKDSSTDTSKFNRSSIAIHLQHHDRSILLSSDSYGPQLVTAMMRDVRWPMEVTLATIPHHGSRRNINRAMADGLKAKFWLVSTNGAGHQHPHADSLSRILVGAKARGERPMLVFNHRHKQAAVWDNASYKAVFEYATCYAEDGEDWITIDLVRD